MPPKSYDIKSDIINEKIIEVIETVYGKEDGGKKYKKEKINDWQITLNDIDKKKMK